MSKSYLYNKFGEYQRIRYIEISFTPQMSLSQNDNVQLFISYPFKHLNKNVALGFILDLRHWRELFGRNQKSKTNKQKNPHIKQQQQTKTNPPPPKKIAYRAI